MVLASKHLAVFALSTENSFGAHVRSIDINKICNPPVSAGHKYKDSVRYRDNFSACRDVNDSDRVVVIAD